MRCKGMTCLPDVLLRVFPPEFIIFFTEAHEGQHTSGEQLIGVRLHLFPRGGQLQSMGQVLQG